MIFANFQTVNVTVNFMIFIKQSREMLIIDFQVMNFINILWEIIAKFVGGVAHYILLKHLIK
mgnify:CR=1 FL=1